MKIRNPFRRSPMHRYLARDADPSLHGQAGTFEAVLTVRLWAPDALLAQRHLERAAGELLGWEHVYLAELTSIARFDEDGGGDGA